MRKPIPAVFIATTLLAHSVAAGAQEALCEASLYSAPEPSIAEALSQTNVLDVRILPTDASATCDYGGVDFRDPKALDGTPCRVKVIVLGDDVAIMPDTLPALFRQRHLALANVDTLEVQGRHVLIDAPLNFAGTDVIVTAKYLELHSGAVFYFPPSAPGRLTLAADDLDLSNVLDGIPASWYPNTFAFGLKASPLTVLARRVFAPKSANVTDAVTLKRFLHNLSSDQATLPDTALAWIAFDNNAERVSQAVYGTSYWPFYTLSRLRSAHARAPYAVDTPRTLLPTLRSIHNNIVPYAKADPRREMLVEGYGTLIERVEARMDSTGLSAYFTPSSSFSAEYSRFKEEVTRQLGPNGQSDQWMQRFRRVLNSSATLPQSLNDEAKRLEQALRTKRARLESLQNERAHMMNLIARAQELQQSAQAVLQETARQEIEYRRRLSKEQEEEAQSRAVLSTMAGIAAGVYTGNPMVGIEIQRVGIEAGNPNISEKQRAATLLAAGYRIYKEANLSRDAEVAQNERQSSAAFGEAIEMLGSDNPSDADYAKVLTKLAEGYAMSSNAAKLTTDHAREATLARMAKQAQDWSTVSSGGKNEAQLSAVSKGLEVAISDLIKIRQNLLNDTKEKTSATDTLDPDLEATKRESMLEMFPERFFGQSKAATLEDRRKYNLTLLNQQIEQMRTLHYTLASGNLTGTELADSQSLLQEIQSNLSKERDHLAQLDSRQRSESSRLYGTIVGHLERAEEALKKHEQARETREKNLKDFMAQIKALGIDIKQQGDARNKLEELPPYLAEALSRANDAQHDLELLQTKALGILNDVSQLKGEVSSLEVQRKALNTLRNSELLTKDREQALNRMYYSYLNALTDDLDRLVARAVRAKAYFTLEPPSESCNNVLLDTVLKPQTRIDLILGENVRERDLETLREREIKDLRLHYTRVESACLAAPIPPDRQMPLVASLAASANSKDAAGRAFIQQINRVLTNLVADIEHKGSSAAKMAVPIPPSLLADLGSVNNGRLGGVSVVEVLFDEQPNDKQVVELSIRRPRAGYVNVSEPNGDDGRCTLFDFRRDTRSQSSSYFSYGIQGLTKSVSQPAEYLVGEAGVERQKLINFSGVAKDMPLYPLGSEYELVITLKGYKDTSGFAASTPSIRKLVINFEFLGVKRND